MTGEDDDRFAAAHVWQREDDAYEAESIDDLGDDFWPVTVADVGDWRLLAGTTSIGGGTSLALLTDDGRDGAVWLVSPAG
jgi:hypothetical protein